MRKFKNIIYITLACLPLLYVLLNVASYIGNDVRSEPPDIGTVMVDGSGNYFVFEDGTLSQKLLSDLVPTGAQKSFTQYFPYSYSPTYVLTADTTGTNSVDFASSNGSTVRVNTLMGRWFILNDTKFYVGSNSSTRIAAYTDETKQTVQILTGVTGDVIYPLYPDNPGLSYPGDKSFENLAAYFSGIQLSVSSAVSNSNSVSYTVLNSYPVKVNCFMGAWAFIGDELVYIGSNSTSRLAIYTDSTKTESKYITAEVNTPIVFVQPVLQSFPVIPNDTPFAKATVGFFAMFGDVGITCNFYTLAAYCLMIYYFVVLMIVIVVEVITFIPTRLTRMLEG